MTDLSVFPYNIARTIQPFLKQIDGVSVFRRRIGPTDPNPSVGITALSWQPDEYMLGQRAPGLSTYMVGVQVYHKNSNQEDGEEKHASLSTAVRNLLLRNQELNDALAMLRDGTEPPFERLNNWNFVTQRFAQEEINESFVFLSGAELTFQTEMVG